MANFNWKSVFKSWVGVTVLILVALATVWLFTNGFPGYQSWQVRRAYEKLAEPYYKDTYGGKTPEETYDLFIDALKKGDVELASKYFVVERQEQWEKTFNEFKRSDSLNDYVEEINQNEGKWILESKSDNNTTFVYQYSRQKAETVELPIAGGKIQQLVLPVGIFSGEVIFYRYPSGVWKISKI